MVSIKINNLKPLGSELFADSENFLHELGEEENMSIFGGSIQSAISQNTVSHESVVNRYNFGIHGSRNARRFLARTGSSGISLSLSVLHVTF
jgi:hypothetical protein